MTSESEINSAIVRLRRRVQRLSAGALSPLVNWLAARGIRPDQITWVGFDLAVAAGVLAAFRLFTLAGILFLLSGVADLLDGALARRAERVSASGAFLDSLLARGGEALLHVGAAVAFAWWGSWPGVLAVALSLSGSHLTSYARARAEALGIDLEEVWVGRGERLIVLSLGLILHFALIAFWVIAVASWASAAHRAWLAHARLAAGKAAESGAGAAPSPGDSDGKDTGKGDDTTASS